MSSKKKQQAIQKREKKKLRKLKIKEQRRKKTQKRRLEKRKLEKQKKQTLIPSFIASVGGEDQEITRNEDGQYIIPNPPTNKQPFLQLGPRKPEEFAPSKQKFFTSKDIQERLENFEKVTLGELKQQEPFGYWIRYFQDGKYRTGGVLTAIKDQYLCLIHPALKMTWNVQIKPTTVLYLSKTRFKRGRGKLTKFLEDHPVFKLFGDWDEKGTFVIYNMGTHEMKTAPNNQNNTLSGETIPRIAFHNVRRQVKKNNRPATFKRKFLLGQLNNNSLQEVQTFANQQSEEKKE